MTELKRAGYLGSETDFNRGQPSLSHLVTHQWDTGRSPKALAITPGLFLTQESTKVDKDAVKALLSRATPSTLRVLARALTVRDEALSERVKDKLSKGEGLSRSRLTSIAAFADSEGREGSMAIDLLRISIQHDTYLSNTLQSLYSLA